jgi:hypothetical protein
MVTKKNNKKKLTFVEKMLLHHRAGFTHTGAPYENAKIYYDNICIISIKLLYFYIISICLEFAKFVVKNQ